MEQRPRWQPTTIQKRIGGTVLVLVLLVIAAYSAEWTGFSGQTLWDWFQLLLVPAMLAAGGAWFNRRQQERDQEAQDRREREREAQEAAQRDRELEVENQRAQDEALQAYLDQISQLITEQQKILGDSDEVGTFSMQVAKARTLTMLPRLDSGRKRSVLLFLYEAGLINAPGGVLDLRGADMAGIQLPDSNLHGANLSGTNLSNADLSGTNLSNADLSGADLSGANPSKAILVSTKVQTLRREFPTNLLHLQRVGFPQVDTNIADAANLSGADLSEAQLLLAELGGANLSNAKLRSAFLAGTTLASANLSGADLGDAFLAGANFENADLRGTKFVRAAFGGARHEIWDYAKFGYWKAHARLYYALTEQEPPDMNLDDVITKTPTSRRPTYPEQTYPKPQ